MKMKCNINEKEENEVFVLELLSELKTQSKRWMIAFFIVLFLWASTIAGFALFLNQYEFESYVQDGEGNNYLNRDVGGDVFNGAEIPENEQEER